MTKLIAGANHGAGVGPLHPTDKLSTNNNTALYFIDQSQSSSLLEHQSRIDPVGWGTMVVALGAVGGDQSHHGAL